jgi:2-polyprenyl-3-methyl-5-hydroxy-6-metoxy-1,4-benzoquinol methylase
VWPGKLPPGGASRGSGHKDAGVPDEEILIGTWRRPQGLANHAASPLAGGGAKAANAAAAVECILAPGVEFYRDGLVIIDSRWSPAGVTAQFLGDAETYHRRYFERLDFVQLIDYCLTLAGIDRDRAMRVLDIGSGGGSSVFAASRLLPCAEIFASDISPQLLGMLATLVDSRDDLRGRVKAFCFDIHCHFFGPEIFDFVIGAAILHHLLDPRAALTNITVSVKPGGKIILIEPLEAGSLVLTAMYAAVLRTLDKLGQGDGDLARLMKALRLDTQCRLGPPVEKPWTAGLDDKWVFDKPYLAELAGQLGLSGVDVYPAQPDLTNVYEGAFRSVLSDSGNGGLSIPEQVWDCVREFDRGIASGLKNELCPTGVIVFTK